MFPKVYTLRGMSFVEMIIVVAMFSLLMITIGNSVSNLYKANAYTFQQAYQVSNARSGVAGMSHDIREMTYGADGSYPLAIMQPNEIGFYSDINNDGVAEYVEYQLATTTSLLRRVYIPTGTPPTYNKATPNETDTLSTYVQNALQGTSTFMYYDMNGTLATSSTLVTSIRYIKMQAIVNIDPVRNPGEFMLQTSVALRNIINSI